MSGTTIALYAGGKWYRAMDLSIIKAKFDEKNMWLRYVMRRMLGVPLELFQLLKLATPHPLNGYELSPRSINTYDLNEVLSLDGLHRPEPLSLNGLAAKAAGFIIPLLK
ncbi:hypothetical protein [Pantoea vagans]|uniref:hypothetical protein n=1 Tax=Pantoea vagans TaxID=470934 RepID=UPI0010938412|nr:hypothetical protein [Pantoea vagans]QCA03507.1 hypothetical protein EGO56_04750 [Pantoea vagans]